MRTIVVSGVNLRKGGTLTIMRQCLEYLAGKTDEYRIVALVHKKELYTTEGIEYIELPWCIKGWGRRLWAEYVTMRKISRQIAAQDGRKVWLWLSMHDTTPRVEAEHQEVYCHTSFPFMKVKAHDWLMDPKIPLFCMFTRWAYRINVKANDSLIVQQEWFADALSSLLHVPREKFRVIPPAGSCPDRICTETAMAFGHPGPGKRLLGADSARTTFFYASTADCHKNFETLCEASRLLEAQVGTGKFKVVLTISGKENRYAKWLYKKWGEVQSIDFHGFMSKEELFGTYAQCSCFVFPSRVETWGLPISEYLGCQPDGELILADLPYAHETSGGKGVYVPVNDAAAMAAAMKTVIERETDTL